jgi:transketolase
MSMVEIALAMYFKILRIDPKNPNWPDRDRYVLSKGHSCIALYTVLALRGFFPLEEVFTYDAIDSRLQGHPDMTKTPGIDMSSGSLGTGASPPLGMALAAKRLGKNFHTWAHLGDGEIQEGQVWEMAFIASQYRVDNLTAIVDYNKVQQFGFPKDGDIRRRINPLVQVPEKWRAFGWHVIECDGHDFDSLIPACEEAKTIKGRPTCIIAHTIKGKGVSFMEGDFNWHAKVPNDEELAKAFAELDASMSHS